MIHGGDAVARRLARRAGVAAIVSAALAAAGAAAAGAQAPVTPPDGSRIASVRMYQDGQYTAKRETPQQIGAALASLRPTYVTALLRYPAGEKVRGREVRAWNTVVSAVRATSPEAQFSVELNALEYGSARRVSRMMSRIRSAVHPDGWLFDFFTPAAKRKPQMIAGAIAAAHANGEFLGGNAFGIAGRPTIPPGTDYVAVQDFDFKIDLSAVRRLATRAPEVFFHLGNSPNLANSDGCQFIERFSTAGRLRYVTKRARQQAANSFHFAYPVYFPECERNRSRRNATLFSYSAPRDRPMMDRIVALMDQFATQAP